MELRLTKYQINCFSIKQNCLIRNLIESTYPKTVSRIFLILPTLSLLFLVSSLRPRSFLTLACLYKTYTNIADRPRLSFCILWERIARDRKPLWRNELPRKLPYKLLCRLLRTESYHPC